MDDNLPPPKAPPTAADFSEAQPIMHDRPFPRYAPPPTKAPSLDFNAIIFALFKHKWKIVTCSLLGFLGAVAVYVLVKPIYRSEAKLLIKYIQDERLPTVTSKDSQTTQLNLRAETIIATEIEILTSADLARHVVAQVGPERILNNPAAASEHDFAAEVMSRGLVVDLPSKMAAVLRVAYAHSDPAVAQSVVQAVIDGYLKRHQEIHRAPNQFAEAMQREADTLRLSLTQAEQELRKLQQQAGTDSLPEQKKIFAALIAKLEQDKMTAQAELAETRAVLEVRTGRAPTQVTATSTEPEAEAPSAKLAEYQRVIGMLASLVQREREYLLQYTPESLVVRGVRTQIAENDKIKARLEAEFPSLRRVPIATPIVAGNTGLLAFDQAAEEAKVAALEARIQILDSQIAEKRAETSALIELEPMITELQRATGEKGDRYRIYVTNRDQRETEAKITDGTNTNILGIQAPSTPSRVPGRKVKFMAGFLFGGVVLGLGLAILLEFLIDQSVRRSSEVEGSLGLPLFFSIPYLRDVAKLGRGPAIAALPAGNKPPGPGVPTSGDKSIVAAGASAPPWSPSHEMRSFFDGLRDRLVFYFEIRNFTRKPKLIAVAGCGENSGVSTIASGLAASLSESGDGNVLLVDMNPGNNTPFHFHKGELKCGLDDALENEKRDDAMVRDNLYVVSHASGHEKLAAILPKRFTKLVPKLKASDYDYIIFDLPPINHTSATPQLARYMDMMLMVVESEKTARETTKRAGTMFADAGVNFGVVLNKTRDYLPGPLRNVLAGDS